VTIEEAANEWRKIILHGENTASYKFALAKAILQVGRRGEEIVSLDELAIPFSQEMCTHIAEVDTQSNSPNSQFLNACRYFNAGAIEEQELIDTTLLFGFRYVIDAFHTLRGDNIEDLFFIDERNTHSRCIRLTPRVLELATSDRTPLEAEVESRWNLVEHAWDERRESGRLLVVDYDRPSEDIVRGMLGSRRRVTNPRPALNGYQKGSCFYCGQHIDPIPGSPFTADVDHFFPHALMSRGVQIDLDHVWNLVLACSGCNRGLGGKFARLPHPSLLERLHRRNEHLITSHHPLRETLMSTTGSTVSERVGFLRNTARLADETGGRTWLPG
jgi:5-methylcytosine-specific restriction endonuclease McrA